MSKGKLAGYDTQADSCNGYDTQAISAAKDFVCDLLYEEAETDCDGSVSNGIDLAEEVIGGLLAAGALIPSDLVYDGNGLHSGREES